MEKLEKERLAKELAKKRKQLGISKRDFAQRMGVDEKTIYNWEHNGNIPETKLKQIESFINGEADINDDNEVAAKTVAQTMQGCPYYDVDFLGGFDLMANNQTNIPDGYISIPAYNTPGLIWCNITGHSMEPMINHGDIIALKELEDWHTYMPKGEVYGIVTTNGLRTVKIVRKGSDENHVRLVPVNISEYDEEEIPLTVIMRVFRIVGNLKRF